MYNRNEVMEAFKKVNDINITVTKKAFHQTKLYEIKQLLLDLMSINKYLFDPDYFYSFCKYKQSIQCNDSKKELDTALNYCIVEIKSQLNGILNTINICTWDEQKQCYIEA